MTVANAHAPAAAAAKVKGRSRRGAGRPAASSSSRRSVSPREQPQADRQPCASPPAPDHGPEEAAAPTATEQQRHWNQRSSERGEHGSGICGQSGLPMGCVLVAVTGLHVLVLLLLFVATLDKGWWVLPDGAQLNLWVDCVQTGNRSWSCSRNGNAAPQALAVSSLLLSAASLLLLLLLLQGAPHGRRLWAAAGTQGMAGLLALAGAGLVTSEGRGPPGSRFGHCLGVAWLGGALALANGIAYGFLRTQ
ncbi:epithelial membrane protein 3-like [Patagioenas fasciata]|uniref:epithelial membrane protein 3-like n=1 Tax=Patagioenas fasciata TaxID=372321 RepID=UPI003A98D403